MNVWGKAPSLEEEAKELGLTYTPPAPSGDVPQVSPELDMAVAAKEAGLSYTPPPAERRAPGLAERLPRALGLTARAGGRAVLTAGGLAEMVGDAIPGLQGRVGPAADAILDAVGLPAPETPEERIAARTAGVMAGAGITGAAAGAARPVGQAAQYLREVLARRLHTQVAGAGGGAAAGGVVHERGGTPGQELAATLAGSFVAPGAAAGRQAYAQRLAPTRAEFVGVGTEPNLGQLTGSRGLQVTEELGMNLPFSRPILERARQRQQADIGRFAERASWRTEPGGAWGSPESMQGGFGGPLSIMGQEAPRVVGREAWLPGAGRAAPTQQRSRETGNRFSTESFLNRTHGIVPENIPDPAMRADFERIGRVADRIRDVRDNTVLARQRGRWSGPLGLVASGIIGGVGLPAVILGSMVAGSKALTNRNFVRWLADASESEGGDLPRRMQQLRVMVNAERDQDTRAAMEEYAANLVEALSTPRDFHGSVERQR